LDPENPWTSHNLAWFLIDNDRNIDEGLILNEKALEKMPDSVDCLDCKGWGLFKLGKYKEAHNVLQKAYDLDANAVHRYTVGLHLEAAKKAVAGQK